MKRSFSFFVVATILALALGAPGIPREETNSSEIDNPNTDTLLVFPGQRFPIYPIVAGIPSLDDNGDEALGLFGGFSHNLFGSNLFKGLFNSMQNTMKKLKEQMEGSLSGVGGLAPWGKFPEGANTTSTTKVIDGHVVTINETVYNGEGDDGNSFFRIRVVDVKPQDDGDAGQESGEVTDKPTIDNKPTETTESTKEATTPARSVETVEDNVNNEIPDSQVDTLKA